MRLEAELESHRQTLTEQRQALSQQSDELQSRSERIEHLKLMVEKLRHVIFGAKSEKILIQFGQLELQDDETTHAEVEASVERVAPLRDPKSRADRKPLPHHFPREVVTHTPEGDCCSDCGGELRHFGDDVSEQLEYVPDSFKVIRHVRPKFSCKGAIGSSKHLQPHAPSSAVWPDPASWPMSSCPSSAIIFPCTGSPRSTLDRMLRSHVRRWLGRRGK